MKYLKLFEDFDQRTEKVEDPNMNPYTAKELTNKLRIYAEASIQVKHVTPIEKTGGVYIFEVYTNMPDETIHGEKKFVVTIPEGKPNQGTAQTVEGGRIVFTASLEPNTENNITDILTNYIEALNLYDDSSVDQIVNAYREIETPSDIKMIIKTLG